MVPAIITYMPNSANAPSLLEYLRRNLSADVTVFGSPVFYIPLLIVLAQMNFVQWKVLLVALIGTEVIAAAIKLLFPTTRPTPRNTQSLLGRYDAGSFPSIHTARAATLATVTTFLTDNLVILGLVCALLAGVAWSRVHLKHHYRIDVLGGLALGFCTGTVTAFLW